MKKQLVIIGIVAILICVILSGCNSTPEEKIIGKWKSLAGEEYYTFVNNGSYFHQYYLTDQFGLPQYQSGWDIYTIAGNKIVMGTGGYS
jgi:hypothetical protein